MPECRSIFPESLSGCPNFFDIIIPVSNTGFRLYKKQRIQLILPILCFVFISSRYFSGSSAGCALLHPLHPQQPPEQPQQPPPLFLLRIIERSASPTSAITITRTIIVCKFIYFTPSFKCCFFFCVFHTLPGAALQSCKGR